MDILSKCGGEGLKLKYEYNGKLVTVIQKVISVIVLSVLWTVCCIPVFTIGASSKALYHSAEWTLGHDLGYPGRTFFREFRKHFGRSVASWIPFMIVSGVLLVNLYVCNHLSMPGNFAVIIMAVLAIVLLAVFVWCTYLYAYQSVFDGDRIRTALRNSYFMMVTHLFRSFMIFVLFALAFLVASQFVFAFVFLPAVISFFHTLILEKVFEEYADEDAWEHRKEIFRIEREKYEQELDDRAKELLHRR